MAYRYILRYLIDPTFEAAERIEELVSFCKRSQIEEVMLFLAAEELSAGHPTTGELDEFIDFGKCLKRRLDEHGIALSLNPWATLYHSARGRRLRDGQKFRLMVGENGRESTISPCPLCPEWGEYLAESFAWMAREIKPTAIWIEDDWRLRNHGSQLGWGGCFCEAHLAIFSEQVGEPVTRESLLEAILAPGAPHPWRQHWLDLSLKSLADPLKAVSSRIREASPTTQVALMSGSPDTHAAEGREWKVLQDAVSGGGKYVGRPTMKPYTQNHALGVPPGLTRLTIANLQGEIEVYPELENSPRCGAYSKSRAYSVWQMLHVAAMGSAGITINHYDMMGNGISLDPSFGDGLADAKPMLNALVDLGIDDRHAEGASILFTPKISRHIKLKDGSGGMWSLSQVTTAWGDAAFILGISHRYSSTVENGNRPVFVNGQTLRAFSDTEIQRLLAGSIILDADSISVLMNRGYGSEIGIQHLSFKELEAEAYAYERIDAERFVAQKGPRHPRMTAQRCSARLAALEPLEGGEVLSTICSADHRDLFPGSILYRNRFGGRIVSLAYPVDGKSQFFMAFFNVYRKTFLQRLLFELAPESMLACVENAPMHAYCSPTKSGVLLTAINPTDDPVDQVVWNITPGSFANGNWRCLERNGHWRAIEPVRQRGGGSCETLTFDGIVSPLSGGFFEFRPLLP